MADTGRLELDIVDVHGMPLTEPVTITLRHRTLDDRRRAENVEAGSTIAISNLRREPQGLYILEVTAPSYRPVQRFVTIPASGSKRETVILPIRADRAKAHELEEARQAGIEVILVALRGLLDPGFQFFGGHGQGRPAGGKQGLRKRPVSRRMVAPGAGTGKIRPSTRPGNGGGVPVRRTAIGNGRNEPICAVCEPVQTGWRTV